MNVLSQGRCGTALWRSAFLRSNRDRGTSVARKKWRGPRLHSRSLAGLVGLDIFAPVAGRPVRARTIEHAIDAASGLLTEITKYAVARNRNWVEIVELP
jgi:hypothetical protein